jgi:hypothetical protein
MDGAVTYIYNGNYDMPMPQFGSVSKNRDARGRAIWRSSFLGLPGAKFFWEKPEMDTKSKKDGSKDLLQAAALRLNLCPNNGAPSHTKTFSKFREQLSKSR